MQVLEQQTVFRGRLLNVRCDRILDAEGRESSREFVVHPGGVSILAMPTPEEVLLVRQYRYPTGESLLELPAGTLEPDEEPLETAHRELMEETGYRARRMEFLSRYYTTPGFTSELMYLYRASDLTPGEQDLEDDESIEVVRISNSDAMDMVRRGEIRDAKTLVGLLTVFSL